MLIIIEFFVIINEVDRGKTVKDLNQEIKEKQQAKAKREQEKIDAFNASPVGMLLDENNVDDIVLFDSDNNPIKFQQVALIPYDKTGKLYAILIPLTPMVGVNPGEGVLFEIDEENSSDKRGMFQLFSNLIRNRMMKKSI